MPVPACAAGLRGPLLLGRRVEGRSLNVLSSAVIHAHPSMACGDFRTQRPNTTISLVACRGHASSWMQGQRWQDAGKQATRSICQSSYLAQRPKQIRHRASALRWSGTTTGLPRPLNTP